MKKLLIVVDYQKDFVNGSLGFKEAEYLDEYLSSLIDQYHQNKDDVIFTFDTHQNNYLETQEGKNLPIEHCIKNSDGWKLYGKVNTAKKEYDICIEKTTFGSLELGNYLKDKNIKIVSTEDIFKDLLKINENISGTSNVVSSIMEYTLNRQLLINGESDLQTSIFYTFYNEDDWYYVLTIEYILENSSNEIYTL